MSVINAFPELFRTTTNEGRDDKYVSYHEVASGMTLRDFFAAHALSGMMFHGFMPNLVDLPIDDKGRYDYPRAAYLIADAMLSARKSEAVPAEPGKETNTK